MSPIVDVALLFGLTSDAHTAVDFGFARPLAQAAPAAARRGARLRHAVRLPPRRGRRDARQARSTGFTSPPITGRATISICQHVPCRVDGRSPRRRARLASESGGARRRRLPMVDIPQVDSNDYRAETPAIRRACVISMRSRAHGFKAHCIYSQ